MLRVKMDSGSKHDDNLSIDSDDEMIEKGDTLTLNQDSSKSSTFTCSIMIALLCVMNMAVNASFSLSTPFLPWLAEQHHVSQSYIGAIFCIDSATMVIASPIFGKYQYGLGRRNTVQWGLAIVGLTFLGFYLVNLLQNRIMFICGFAFLRIMQGIGTSMSQTAIFAILTLSYPDHVNAVVGFSETGAGLGLSLGPVLGTVLYEVGNLSTPFFMFFCVCTLLAFSTKFVIPELADKMENNEIDTSKISYCELLRNPRILFANLCVFFAVFQFAFIDPLLEAYLHDQFGMPHARSGYFFLSLGCGYSISCMGAPLTAKFKRNRHICVIAAILMGIFTMMYGPSYILHLPPSIYLIVIGLFFGGLANGHLTVLSMDEMIDASQEQLEPDQNNEAINDICSGLYNMSFSSGEICGPLIGNFIFSSLNFAWTCDIFGIVFIAFGVLYYITSITSKYFA